MQISLAMVTLLIPESQNVAISMRGGNISANIELLTEPTNEITALKFGIAAANRTKIKKTIIQFNAWPLRKSFLQKYSLEKLHF